MMLTVLVQIAGLLTVKVHQIRTVSPGGYEVRRRVGVVWALSYW